MEVFIDWDAPEKREMMEIGNFNDLEHLVTLLNEAWEGDMHYELNAVDGQKGTYIFMEDDPSMDEYECGVVRKVGNKAMAISEAVHEMVLGAYNRYLEEFGGEMAA